MYAGTWGTDLGGARETEKSANLLRYAPIGTYGKINFITVFAGQAVGIKDPEDGTWLVRFMDWLRKSQSKLQSPHRVMRHFRSDCGVAPSRIVRTAIAQRVSVTGTRNPHHWACGGMISNCLKWRGTRNVTNRRNHQKTTLR